MLWNKLELDYLPRNLPFVSHILDSIVVSIPACHAGDRGSIPRRGDFLEFSEIVLTLLQF